MVAWKYADPRMVGSIVRTPAVAAFVVVKLVGWEGREDAVF
jgi:hypothetical protein